jgi:dTDP-glucose 4,6-dehydratase
VKYKPRNLLITGGAGFIGSHFVRLLLQTYKNITVVTLDALTYAGKIANIADLIALPNHHFINGNITDRELLTEIFRLYNIDTVVHFAAETHVDRSLVTPKQFIDTNIVGTYTLLEVAKEIWQKTFALDAGLCRFHHISTDEVFGSLTREAAPFTESSPYEPNSPYSASKASSDFLVRAYFKSYNLPYTLSNCSNNFGPYQHSEKFIPTVINACLQNLPIPIYGDGSNIRDWLYVEDHCVAIDLIIKQGTVANSYNIGGNYEVSNYHLAKIICVLMDNHYPGEGPYAGLIHFIPDRAGHDWRYAISTEKVQQEFGWQPNANFQGNLLKTIDWYVDHSAESVQGVAV